MAKSPPWTREELIVAFNLYLKLPFGKMHKTNVEVINLSNLLVRRTPDSVAMRLTNFASVDPYHQNRGVKGMDGGRRQVEPIWNEFVNNQEELAFESERILAKYQQKTVEELHPELLINLPNVQGEVREHLVKTRVNQTIFRQMILKTYRSTCAISGIDVPDLLVAGHIVPWAENAQERLNPENGICLSNLYDKAYERGYICIDTDFKILISKTLKDKTTKSYYQTYFGAIENRKIALPADYLPKREFLEYRLARFS
jgi:putative restriction endonuclease